MARHFFGMTSDIEDYYHVVNKEMVSMKENQRSILEEIKLTKAIAIQLVMPLHAEDK